jgi:hypothetical protein
MTFLDLQESIDVQDKHLESLPVVGDNETKKGGETANNQTT